MRAPEIEVTPYDTFKSEMFDWKQGEHVATIGPTGSGKTTVGLDILNKRKYVTVIGTKPRDSTLSEFAKTNKYKVIKEFPQFLDPDIDSRLILWPKTKSVRDLAIQRQAIGHGLQTMYFQENWAVFADEVSYIVNDLQLERELKRYWQQGRSIGLSLIAGTQRPAFVPLLIYSQSTHLFFFRDNDEVNLKRIGGIGAINSKVVKHVVSQLPKFHFLYLNTRTGNMVISKVSID